MTFYASELRDMPANTPVRVVVPYGTFEMDQIIYRKLSPADGETSFKFSEKPGGEGTQEWMTGDEVEAVVEESPPAVACGNPGIARPILTERKIGKIQIDLFDQGFPNAVMKIAEVMTWAAENKGYKPHDWKNLPDPERAFQGAASRHNLKHNIMRGAGFSADTCVDEESFLVHKAHQAFNVLAELELILTGRIH